MKKEDIIKILFYYELTYDQAAQAAGKIKALEPKDEEIENRVSEIYDKYCKNDIDIIRAKRIWLRGANFVKNFKRE